MRPTAEGLRERLSYDPATGVITWRTGKQRGRRAGCLASNGYWRVEFDRRAYPLHRVAWALMTGEWPDRCIDHINRDRADNRWENLRLADAKQNAQNMGVSRRNRSGHVGVAKVKRVNRWAAYIEVAGKNIHLGNHKTIESAIAAREAAKAKFHPFGDPLAR